MFTNNYITFQNSIFNGNTSPKMKDENGSNQTAYLYLQNSLPDIAVGRNVINPSLYGSGLRFGSGSTPATKEDYCLASPITSGLAFSKGSLLWDKNTPGKYIAKASHVLTNTSEVEINIYEVGLFCTCYASTSLSSPVTYSALFERTVLPEPITIAPGEAKLVTYKLTFNQTLNVE